MGHGIGSVPAPRTLLLPTLLVLLTHFGETCRTVNMCRPTSSGSKWIQPTDGLKSVFQTDRTFHRDQGQGVFSLTLGQRNEEGLRERSVKLDGSYVNSLFEEGWR